MAGVDRYIEFSKRHSRSVAPTLNAASTLWRLQCLLEDIDSLDKLRSTEEGAFPEQRIHIYSYYIVAISTCLEWHARSRLTDFFTFKPSAIEAQDIERNFRAPLLIQMAEENLSIPHLLGAMKNVSSKEEYLSLFNRVFKGLNIDFDFSNLIKGANNRYNPYNSKTDFLDFVFSERNRLVHEINYDQVGPWSIREYESLDNVRSYLLTTVWLIEEIERAITTIGPSNFPNVLDIDGNPVDELSSLKLELSSLESQFYSEYALNTDDDILADIDYVDLVNKSISGFSSDVCMVTHTQSLNIHRAFDFRKPILIDMYRSRIRYLNSLLNTEY